ncbi:SdpI family protein [Frisingicoccus sp.]|uniref:SdpI family protein n=1 Tax=Frisingicoccus sp. TaxID=1918627 RepID=UPI003AB587E4
MKKLFDKKMIVLLIIAVISLIGHVCIYPMLPERIPIQWSSDGSVSNWGAKYMDLVLAALPILILLFMKAAPYIDPRRANYRKHPHAYDIVIVGVTLLLIACSWLSAFSGLGYDVNIQTLIPAGIGILFIALGNTMPQIRPTYFFGIKTPWTLENPDVWRKTHKFGGILFCIIGVFFLLSAFFGSELFVHGILVPIILGSVAILYIYSYIVYRKMQS